MSIGSGIAVAAAFIGASWLQVVNQGDQSFAMMFVGFAIAVIGIILHAIGMT